MTLEEAIKHCEDVAEDRCGCAEDCVNEHRQLAEWLKELKAYREANTPQTETQTEIQNSNLTFEKQTGCAWMKGE